MLTVSQVAKRANVAPNTVRNHVREYPDLFSEAARGLQGNRLFGDDDVEALCSLVALKNSGMPLADAAERIRLQAAPSVIDVDATTLQAPATAQDAPQITALALSSVQSQIEALRADFRTLQGHQQRVLDAERWQGRVQGAIAALAAGAFVLWLLYLLGG